MTDDGLAELLQAEADATFTSDFGDERWLPVPGWDGYYEVSDHGRVRSVARYIDHGMPNARPRPVRERILSLKLSSPNSVKVNLSRAGERLTTSVHRLVLGAFVGPCPPGMEGCHYDGNNRNNRLENLRWDTPSSNQYDNVRLGVHRWAKRTHCKNGHEFTPENTYRAPSYPERRICLQCHNAFRAITRARKREARLEMS